MDCTVRAEDAWLLERIGAGDAAALARLFDLHSMAVRRLVAAILRAEGEAEDVLQETFLHVWEQAHRYDPSRAAPLGWLLMLARSRALDRLRCRDARRRYEQSAAVDACVSSAPPRGTERLEENERRDWLHAALDALSAKQRRSIELAFYEGLTQTQIAARLAAPLGTVKSRILQGMKKLRHTLLGLEAERARPAASSGSNLLHYPAAAALPGRHHPAAGIAR
jgi:RNA polymerase sigma-70 factor (ECF subfamily)